MMLKHLFRFSGVALLALSLSACVTLPGASGADAAPSASAGVSSGISALGDFFSPEVREFKKLVTEGKMDEALAFANSKEAFFEERYKASNAAPAEFVRLAEHLLSTDWRPKLLAASVGLNTSLVFDSANARAQATAALKTAEEAQAVVEKALLYKITPVGRPEVASLTQARNALKERATAAKPEVAAGMLDFVLANAGSSFDYVGPLNLERSDFVASPGFQAAAMARLNAAPDRAELERLAQRLGEFLTSDNQAAADQRFADMVRKALLADGRITLEELGQLVQMATPITRSKEPLKGLVKVGFASQMRSGGARDFTVRPQRDLPFDVEEVGDEALKNKGSEAYDFVYFLMLNDAAIQREGGSPRSESSRYRAGTDRLPNPAHSEARSRLSKAESTLREVRAKVAQSGNVSCPPGKLACVLAMAAVQFGVASAEQEVYQARKALETTPQTLEKPRMVDYQYRVKPLTLVKEARGLAVLWDVKGKQAWLMSLAHKAQRSFNLVDGVRAEDPDQSSIVGRFNRDSEQESFARDDVALSLNEQFAPSRLASVKPATAADADALLRLIEQENDRIAPRDEPPSVGRMLRLSR